MGTEIVTTSSDDAAEVTVAVTEPLPRIGAQNIVDLCTELVGIYKRADITVSVTLCARIAFLVSCLSFM